MNDLIYRQAAIDCVTVGAKPMTIKGRIAELPSVQPEEAIPVSWIEAMIKKLMMSGDSFGGLTASIIRLMLNEWKKEQEGDTT